MCITAWPSSALPRGRPCSRPPMRRTRNDSLPACPIRQRFLRRCGSIRRHAQVSRKRRRSQHRLGLLTWLRSHSLSSVVAPSVSAEERLMGRRARPSKGKTQAKRLPARKSAKEPHVTVRDLKKRLADAQQREADALKREAETLARQTATSDILEVISRSQADVQPVFDAIVQSAQRLLHTHSAALRRLVGEDLIAAAYTTTTFEGEHLAPPRASFSIHSFPGTAARQRAASVVADMLTDPRMPEEGRDTARRRGYRSFLSIPLLREHHVLGLINVTRREPGGFADHEIELLKTFADQAVIAIENVRLFTELQTSNRELTTALDTQTATSDILRVISRSQTDVQPVFDAIVVSAVRLLRGHMGALTRVIGDEIHRAAHTFTSGFEDPTVRTAFPRSLHAEGTHAQAIRERVPVNIADQQTDPALSEERRAIARALGHRSLVAVPLLRRGEAIGTIGVTRREAGGFTDDEVALLQTFADQAIIAIENVRLFTELKQKNEALTQAHAQVTEALEQQTATSEILRVISSAHSDAQPVFDTIVQSAARLCNATMTGVVLTDGTTLYHPANFGGSPEVLAVGRARYPRPLDMHSQPGIAILTRSVVHVPDIEEPSVREFVRQGGRLLGIRSWLTVPMLREGEAVGAIAVGRRDPGRFSDAEVKLLQTFADQAVIAIENVRLFTELEARNRDLSESLDRQTATSEILRVISSSPTDVQP